MPKTEAYKENSELDEILISVATSNRLIIIVFSVQVTMNNRKV